MCISIPPKYANSKLIGHIKAKSAIQIARQIGNRQRSFAREKFWARGYFDTTVGLDEAMVRAGTRLQESEDELHEQRKLGI